MNKKIMILSFLLAPLSACNNNNNNNEIQDKPVIDQPSKDDDSASDEPAKPAFKAGDKCQWFNDFLPVCSGNDLLECDPFDEIWVATPCKENELCLEQKDGAKLPGAQCYKKCQPDDYVNHDKCEDPDTLGTNPIGTSYICQAVKDGQFAVIIEQKYCSECNGNQCVIDIADFGAQAENGDGCNPFIFEARCQNGVLYNCEQFKESVSEGMDLYYGVVIKRTCANGCQLVANNIGGKFAICNDDSREDYSCALSSDNESCSIRQCFVDNSNIEGKTECTWELYPKESDKCSDYSINSWINDWLCEPEFH